MEDDRESLTNPGEQSFSQLNKKLRPLIGCIFFFSTILAASFIIVGLVLPAPPAQDEPTSPSTPATQEPMWVFDGHNDLSMGLAFADILGADHALNDLQRAHPTGALTTDIPSLRAGKVGAQVFAAYTPTYDPNPVESTLHAIDSIRTMVDKYDDFELAMTAQEVTAIQKAGKIAALISVEGGHSIDSSLGILRAYRRLGVSSITLTHFASTSWAFSSEDLSPSPQGLSAFGVEVVKEMNKLGMLIDLSHTADSTAHAVLNITKSPVIFSHSSARAVADVRRNVPDDILTRVAENGGVVMVNFFAPYVNANYTMAEFQRGIVSAMNVGGFNDATDMFQRSHDESPNAASISKLVDHIDHIVAVAGIDHVGIGSDFGALSVFTTNLTNPSHFPLLVDALRLRGYGDEQLAKILHENVLRVFAAAHTYARMHDNPEDEVFGNSPANKKFLESMVVSASVTSAMDPTTDPCENFYRYACGGWLDQTVIPSDKTRVTRSFTGIAEKNEIAVRSIVESQPASSQIGKFYASCMDAAELEAAGTTPVSSVLASIDTITSLVDLNPVLADLQYDAVNAFFGFWVGQDPKEPDTYELNLIQGGLGLPGKVYYANRTSSLVMGYQAHIANMFVLFGSDASPAANIANTLVDFESSLAAASVDRADLRDTTATYHRLTWSELETLTTANDQATIDWAGWRTRMGVPASMTFVLDMTPSYFGKLAGILANTPIEDLKNYLRWRVMSSVSGYLTEAIRAEHFDFFGRKLSGRAEQSPRWKQCLSATEGAFGFEIGKVFIKTHFPAGSKELAVDMIQRIKDAFAASLPENLWMDNSTRTAALEKLNKIAQKIGYPDDGEWPDYSSIETSATDYYGNGMRVRRWAEKEEMDKLGKPVDRGEWFMYPQTVNAYYEPTTNDINFPVAIMQQPFFDLLYPMAVNFGAIGMVMGHELTHAFDDQGRQQDGDGRLRSWWAEEAVTNFKNQAQCVIDWYNNYNVAGTPVNGVTTLGENLADFGGIHLAHSAYTTWKTERAASGMAPELGVWGLTDEQLFFVSFAQGWCTKITPEQAQIQVNTDPHSPAQFRVMGPLANLPAFADAFQCRPGTPMAPVDRCHVW